MDGPPAFTIFAEMRSPDSFTVFCPLFPKDPWPSENVTVIWRWTKANYPTPGGKSLGERYARL